MTISMLQYIHCLFCYPLLLALLVTSAQLTFVIMFLLLMLLTIVTIILLPTISTFEYIGTPVCSLVRISTWSLATSVTHNLDNNNSSLPLAKHRSEPLISDISEIWDRKI
jgi:hypothetical protein